MIKPMYALKTVEEIADFIIKHQRTMAALHPDWGSRRHGRINSVEFTEMKLGPYSASHTAPLGKTRNFADPEKFLGLRGRIKFTHTGEQNIDFKPLGICTGSGGGGGGRLSYEVILWAEDFPAMIQPLIDDVRADYQAKFKAVAAMFKITPEALAEQCGNIRSAIYGAARGCEKYFSRDELPWPIRQYEDQLDPVGQELAKHFECMFTFERKVELPEAWQDKVSGDRWHHYCDLDTAVAIKMALSEPMKITNL